MGVLRSGGDGGTMRPLPARLLVGRGDGSGLVIPDPLVSAEHATIRWTPEGWIVRDLGSRNGTWVDRRKLAPGESCPIVRGAVLAFGSPKETWTLLHDEPPGPVAERVGTSDTVHAVRSLLALPDDTHPEWTVYAEGQSWFLESSDGDFRVLRSPEVVRAGGALWRIEAPEFAEVLITAKPTAALESAKYRFLVSANEEQVALGITIDGNEQVLDPREHWYLLLVLARRRLAESGLPKERQGWIPRDDLLRMLATDTNALNVAIFRARRQLEEAGVEGAGGIVEVSRGQRRIGVDAERIRIDPLPS